MILINAHPNGLRCKNCGMVLLVIDKQVQFINDVTAPSIINCSQCKRTNYIITFQGTQQILTKKLARKGKFQEYIIFLGLVEEYKQIIDKYAY